MHATHEFTWVTALAAVGIALIYISLSSLVSEPNRQRLSAVILAGAGATYLNGGLGGWEFGFCTLMTWVAFNGLTNYYWIGIGWLLHTGWDVMHHLYGNPIVGFDPTSSAGCALCDALLALWFFWSAPSVFSRIYKRSAVLN